MHLTRLLSLAAEEDKKEYYKGEKRGNKRASPRIEFFGGFERLASEYEITNITDDSRSACDGALFVAIGGERYDGNDFICDATRRGALVIATERNDIKIEFGIVIIVENARKYLAEITRAFFGFPDKSMTVIGITGTKGKTTVASLARDILGRLGIRALMCGTVGITGIDYPEYKCTNTTPGPLELFYAMRRAVDEGIRVAVLEISSQALRDNRCYGITFDFVAFTSLSRDHIGTAEHPSFCDYIASKRRLFRTATVRSCIVNSDDAYSMYFSSGIGRVVHCGMSRFADYRVSGLCEGFSGMRFTVSNFPVKSSLVGGYNAVNIAIAVAIVSEVCAKGIEEILPLVEGLSVPGRFEHYSIGGRDVIIDYAHNPLSFREIISLAKGLTRGRVIAVFGSVGGRSRGRRRELAEAACELADFSFITSDNPNFEDPYEIASEIYSGFKDSTRAEIVCARDEAICRAYSYSRPGDVILLLGKGHEEYMLTEGRRLHFSEREIIAELAKGGG